MIKSDYTYEPIGNGVMPILGYVSPPPANVMNQGNINYITENSYRSIKESGINIVVGLYESYPENPNQIPDALNCSYKTGIEYLVKDTRLSTQHDYFEKQLTNNYINKPGCAGVLCIDEPNREQFSTIAASYKNFKKQFPNKIFYVNMLAMYATSKFIYGTPNEEGGERIPSKEEYIKFVYDYLQIVDPPFISYDFYPCLNEFPSIENDYFVQMSIIRKAALQYNIPFWTFVQTCSFKHNVTRIPTKADINWQVNTSLAYGAKGIQYFTLWAPFNINNDPSIGEYFTGGILSNSGNKNQEFQYVKDINKHIAVIDHILMKCISIGIMQTGSSPAPIPSEDLVTESRGIFKISSTQGLLVGCFDYQGKEVYYIINNCLSNENTVNFQIKNTTVIQIIQKAIVREILSNRINLNLEAGEGVLIYIK